MKGQSRIQKFFYFYIVAFFGFLICLIIGNLFELASFYFHEIGHYIFAIISNIIYNSQIPVVKFGFINISAPFPFPIPNIFEIPVPQNTVVVEGINYSSIGFGGPFFVLIFSFLICLVIYYRINQINKALILIIPFIMLAQQIFANFLCGTDMPIQKLGTLKSCDVIGTFFQNFTPYVIAIIIFAIFFLPILSSMWVETESLTGK